MGRLIRFSILLTLASSFLVHGYVLDFTCDCYGWIEESVNSAFGLADNAWNMLEAAKKDTGTSDPKTAAVKALSKVMFGTEDAAWTKKGDTKLTPQDVYGNIKEFDQRKKVSYEKVLAQPDVKVIEEADGTKRPEKGWMKKATAWEFVFYCDLKNWTPATGSDKGKIYDWGLDAVLETKVSDQIKSAMDSCLVDTPKPGVFTTAAFAYSRGHPNDITIPVQVSQIALCPWHLRKSQKLKQKSVSQLKQVFDQFKGDPKGITNQFKSMFSSEQPEIEKYAPEDFNILHEVRFTSPINAQICRLDDVSRAQPLQSRFHLLLPLKIEALLEEQKLLTEISQLTHLPNYGKSIDATGGKRCYGWRNCAKLSSTDDGVINADSLALFALALWFVSQDVCVTQNGNLVPSDAALKACGASKPTLDDSTKDQDAKWFKEAQQEGWTEMEVVANPSSSNGDAKFIPSYEFSVRP
ncbi:hypothetical protein BDV96DRAFT_673776 [Lophiotrema nucula]|uniref:Uncharacterized protein n=1 Tax=Lophiotrema nucula TaxID=690887 RepID=A0A6A5YIL3_9PLEO|nr:hypothetical protein BDV96DRAFT_673776 [Lophiotrema nucula]